MECLCSERPWNTGIFVVLITFPCNQYWNIHPAGATIDWLVSHPVMFLLTVLISCNNYTNTVLADWSYNERLVASALFTQEAFELLSCSICRWLVLLKATWGLAVRLESCRTRKSIFVDIFSSFYHCIRHPGPIMYRSGFNIFSQNL